MPTLDSPAPPVALWRRVVAPPSTRIGRRAAWLTGAAMALLTLVGGLVAAGVADWGWAARNGLGVFSLVAVLAAVAGGVMAARAIARGERSIIELAPLLFGALCFFFLAGELLVPH